MEGPKKNDPTYRQIEAERKREERKSRTPAQVESTRYQDECQSAHWCYDQITIHPIVCYYSDALGKTVTHEVIIDTHQEPARNIEPIIGISVDNDMRKTVFQYIYDDFQNASSFEELQLIYTRHTDLIDEIPFLGSSCHSVISTAKTVDKLSLDIWPQDEPQKHIVKSIQSV
ncbi:unnamed protein product [Mytilus coruscus]|uniref:Uncharacterized protein n=1 Tax=Mytilus coruscus TaxID=42192 RepID=A0A6J8E8G0_MYTCO|nr:unnamed protein product [Mytilus coruscus]